MPAMRVEDMPDGQALATLARGPQGQVRVALRRRPAAGPACMAPHPPSPPCAAACRHPASTCIAALPPRALPQRLFLTVDRSPSGQVSLVGPSNRGNIIMPNLAFCQVRQGLLRAARH